MKKSSSNFSSPGLRAIMSAQLQIFEDTLTQGAKATFSRLTRRKAGSAADLRLSESKTASIDRGSM